MYFVEVKIGYHNHGCNKVLVGLFAKRMLAYRGEFCTLGSDVLVMTPHVLALCSDVLVMTPHV